MGGFVVFLDHTQARLGERECIPDVARNLARWVQGIVARVYEQRVLEEMAHSADIPVVNALSDKFHPCQALADFFTLEEKFGSLRGFKLCYVGDGNNVCHSLVLLAARLGVHLRIATPANYAPVADVLADAKRAAKETRAKIELFTDPKEAERLFKNFPDRLEKFRAKGSALAGDVHPDAIHIAGALTPVPGGVGPMTITMLMSNTVKATRLRRASPKFSATQSIAGAR